MGGVTYTGMRVWFSYATKFRTFSQKYEKYEIKSRTKISAITLANAQHPYLWVQTEQDHYTGLCSNHDNKT